MNQREAFGNYSQMKLSGEGIGTFYKQIRKGIKKERKELRNKEEKKGRKVIQTITLGNGNKRQTNSIFNVHDTAGSNHFVIHLQC
jgi:hypothetical protein